MPPLREQNWHVLWYGESLSRVFISQRFTPPHILISSISHVVAQVEHDKNLQTSQLHPGHERKRQHALHPPMRKRQHAMHLAHMTSIALCRSTAAGSTASYISECEVFYEPIAL